MKLSELRPGMEDLILFVDLISLEDPREVETYSGIKHTIVEGKITDGKKVLNFTVWNESIEKLKEIKPGDKIKLTKAFITSYKGNLSVNVGREAKIIKQ
jgi:ssDNA-binding replication factor A large subunit